MTIYSFSVVEYDRDQPTVIRATHTGSVELDRAADFKAWAAIAWPGERFKAKLDPGQADRFG